MCESRFYSIQRRLKIGSEKNVFRGGCLKLKKKSRFLGESGPSRSPLPHPESARMLYIFEFT